MTSGRFTQSIEDFWNAQESFINSQKTLVSFGEYQRISDGFGVLGRVCRRVWGSLGQIIRILDGFEEFGRVSDSSEDFK